MINCVILSSELEIEITSIELEVNLKIVPGVYLTVDLRPQTLVIRSFGNSLFPVVLLGNLIPGMNLTNGAILQGSHLMLLNKNISIWEMSIMLELPIVSRITTTPDLSLEPFSNPNKEFHLQGIALIIPVKDIEFQLNWSLSV